jgi:hypothetical protein
MESLLFNFIEIMIPRVFGMPIQINFVRTSPENDVMFNEKARKATMGYMSKREGLLKKHGIKDLGAWVVLGEHLTIFVGEAPSLDAFQKLMMEPEYIALTAYATIERKVVLSMEEAMKMLKQAK